MRGPLLRIFRTFSAIIETGKICFCFLLGQRGLDPRNMNRQLIAVLNYMSLQAKVSKMQLKPAIKTAISTFGFNKLVPQSSLEMKASI